MNTCHFLFQCASTTLFGPFRAAAVCLLGTAAASAQNLTIGNGDLLLGFYEISADGTSTGDNTCILNLGPAATWRETQAATTLITNIKTDLDTAFPGGWADNPNVRMAVAATVPAGTSPALNGDPARTVYLSRGAATFASGATESFSLSANQMGSASTQILNLTQGMHNQPAGANPAGAVVGTSVNNNFSRFFPPVSTTYFAVSVNPLTSFGPGNIGNSGAYAVEAAADVYRLLYTLTDADLTAAQSAGNAVLRSGQYIGTFTLDAAGNVRMDVPAAAQTPDYSSWADSFTLAGADRAPNADPDLDSLPNAVEFVTGGNPKSAADSALAPGVTAGTDFVEFVFRRTKASAYLNPAVEQASGTSGPWTPAVHGTGGVTVAVTDLDTDTELVTVRLPRSGNRGFARLRVTVP